MATIKLFPHNERPGTWILYWSERHEVIGRVVENENRTYAVSAQGPHWNPMKSFAGTPFARPEDALREVQLYFQHR